MISRLRLDQMHDLSAAALEGHHQGGYVRAYDTIVRLGLLTELQLIVSLLPSLASLQTLANQTLPSCSFPSASDSTKPKVLLTNLHDKSAFALRNSSSEHRLFVDSGINLVGT
ncbi:unnamed protein product [Protopolystoma xenopodis]|uniref:Uncharacterized protein n=1 Tax=Protopolystoma xenopodis TaxID=117903 RepID=A0A3S5B5D3_9PLAT|nr:unnamed protein product [Protopolystoma xenopodis]